VFVARSLAGQTSDRYNKISTQTPASPSPAS
jgi:hypothetical protein